MINSAGRMYIIHRWDSSTPIKETLQALHDVVAAGTVSAILLSGIMSAAVRDQRISRNPCDGVSLPGFLIIASVS